MNVKWLATCLFMVASAASCPAEDAVRPKCTKKNVGQMWPEAANHDHKVLSRLAHCGELQMCIRDVWRYRWDSLTVRLDQLRGGSAFRKPAGCEVLPDAGTQDRAYTSEVPAEEVSLNEAK